MRSFVGMSLVVLVACGGTNSTGDGDSSANEAETSTSTDGSSTTATGDEDGDTSTGSGDEWMDIFDMPPEVMLCDTLMPSCEPGLKCTMLAEIPGSFVDMEVCVPIMGDDQPGDPCTAFGDHPGTTGLDTCAAGSWCTDIPKGETMGMCIEFCTGTAVSPMCSDGHVCEMFSDKIPANCRIVCDPLEPDSCGQGNVCVFGGLALPYCRLDMSGDTGAYGDTCYRPDSCDPGLNCHLGEEVPGCGDAEACCTPFCDLNTPDCPDGMLGVECVPLFEAGKEPEGLEDVGVCQLP